MLDLGFDGMLDILIDAAEDGGCPTLREASAVLKHLRVRLASGAADDERDVRAAFRDLLEKPGVASEARFAVALKAIRFVEGRFQALLRIKEERELTYEEKCLVNNELQGIIDSVRDLIDGDNTASRCS